MKTSRKTPDKPALTPDKPALFLTTQTTLPTLAAVAAALSFAAIGFVFTLPGISQSLIPLVGLDTKEASILLLTSSSFLYLFAVLACVESHAWDYHALSVDRRQLWNISDEEPYKARCDKRSRLWHRFAAWGHNTATIALLLGLASLMWDVSKLGSVLTLSYLVFGLIVSLVAVTVPDTMESVMTKLEKRLVE